MTRKPSRRDYIHAQMSAIYFNRWTSPIGTTSDTAEMRAWAADMGALTMAQIDAGLRACRQSVSEWPPSPGQFKSWCLGVPALARALLEYSPSFDGTRSPFVRKMAEYVDGYRLRQASADVATRMLRDAYDLTVEFVMGGGALPETAAAAIEQQPTTTKPIGIPETREARAERLAHLAAVIPGFSELRELYNPPSTDEE